MISLLILAILNALYIRSSSRFTHGPTMTAAYTLKRFQPQAFLDVVIPNISYGLSSNWDWACHTADYWRHFFNIPLVHGHHPYTPIDIVPPRTSHAPPPTTDLAQLARQLEDSWTAALASGEMQQGSHLLNSMNFIDALRAIGQREQPTESTSS